MLRIRELRKKSGLTLKKLGKKIGVAESTVSQYETGKRQPDYETLTKIAEIFHVSVDYLLENDEIPSQNSKSPDMEIMPRDELERQIIQMARELDPAQRELLLRLLTVAAENAKNQRNPPPLEAGPALDPGVIPLNEHIHP